MQPDLTKISELQQFDFQHVFHDTLLMITSIELIDMNQINFCYHHFILSLIIC